MRPLLFSILTALLTPSLSVFAQSNPFDGISGGARAYSDPALYAKQKPSGRGPSRQTAGSCSRRLQDGVGAVTS